MIPTSAYNVGLLLRDSPTKTIGPGSESRKSSPGPERVVTSGLSPTLVSVAAVEERHQMTAARPSNTSPLSLRFTFEDKSNVAKAQKGDGRLEPKLCCGKSGWPHSIGASASDRELQRRLRLLPLRTRLQNLRLCQSLHLLRHQC